MFKYKKEIPDEWELEIWKELDESIGKKVREQHEIIDKIWDHMNENYSNDTEMINLISDLYKESKWFKNKFDEIGKEYKEYIDKK